MTVLLRPPIPSRPHLSLDCTVSRRIACAPPCRASLPVAGETLPIGPSGALVVDTPFEPVRGGWRAYARLATAVRRGRGERVELVITQWSATAGELRVVPRSHHSAHWGARRLLRYFDLAHDAADALAARLTAALPPAPRVGTGLDSPFAGAPTVRERIITTRR